MKSLEKNSEIRDTHVLIETYITFPESKNLGSLIYLCRFRLRINDHKKKTSTSFDCRCLILILICKLRIQNEY